MTSTFHRDSVRRIAVIGAGSWGTALADHLGRAGYAVSLWAYEKEVAEEIGRKRENSVFLPGFRLSGNISPTSDLESAAGGADIILFVVPSHVARSVLKGLKQYLPGGVPLISATKGIETDTLLLPTEVIEDVLGEDWHPLVGTISGPSFAREVVRGLPTAVSLAAGDISLAVEAQAVFSSESFRVYTNPDVIGLQIGGAVKNVMAIAAGISDGLDFGNNARAALITRGLAEMKRLGISMGAAAETFAGLSGLGDLVLTCTGNLSRNRTLGMKLGEGLTLEEILASMKMVAEGVHTSEAIVKLAARQGVEMPICEQTHAIIHEGKKPTESFRELMSRVLKDEAADRPL